MWQQFTTSAGYAAHKWVGERRAFLALVADVDASAGERERLYGIAANHGWMLILVETEDELREILKHPPGAPAWDEIVAHPGSEVVLSREVARAFPLDEDRPTREQLQLFQESPRRRRS